MTETSTTPILYSLRNCPYAMRARLALFASTQQVMLRDVVLTNKPDEMIAASAKATVPILVLAQSSGAVKVIDQSLDIMLWAFAESDPADILHKSVLNKSELSQSSSLPSTSLHSEMMNLIATFDDEFKECLNKYMAAKRYREDNVIELRQACEVYIASLELRLNLHSYFMSDHQSLADLALLPFLRKFARVERQWYLQSPYPNLRAWLNNYLQSAMFSKVMAKHPLWIDTHEAVLFPG